MILGKNFSLDNLSGGKTSLEADIWRSRMHIVVLGALYPLWTFIQNFMDPDPTDSLLERVIVYLLALTVLAISTLPQLSPETKFNIVRGPRWLITAHYFSVVARNQISVQYAFCAYFLVFGISSLFNTRKYFLLYAFSVIVLSLFCGEGGPELPGYLFQLGIATSLLISFVSLASRLKLIESLKSSESLFRSIFQKSEVGMLTVDLQGQISMVNTAVENMLGSQDSFFNTKHLADWTPSAERSRVTLTLQNFLDGKTDSLKIELNLNHANGTPVWTRISGTIIKSHGKSQFAFLLLENISQQKSAEDLLILHQERLSHASKMTALGEMAGGIAHEVNSPLAAISLSAQGLLKKSKDHSLTPDVVEKNANRILETVSRISRIIQGLRNFSRSGNDLNLVSTSVTSIIDECLNICQEPLASAGIPLRIVGSIDSDLFVNCRPVEISQVLVNLLNNAKDAIKNLDDKWISIEVQRSGHEVKILIVDSGPGIPIEIQKKMFQPFFTTKPLGEGTGLGLSISLGIVRSHGGSLDYNSSGPHSQFVITLPRSNPT